jgi:hypothetical protein
MSELIQLLREYWCNNTAIARREWRNEHGSVALVESDMLYPCVVLCINGKLTIMPYDYLGKYDAMIHAQAIAALAGAEEVVEPMERVSGI